MARNAWDYLRKKDVTMRALLDSLVKIAQPDIVCDIGSFNADEAVRFHHLSPSSQCCAFEANSRNIEKYIAIRADIGDVRVIHSAVADIDGELEFNVLEAEGEQEDWRRAAGSLIERTDGVVGNKVIVQSVRLDTFFSHELAENKTFILWIDVEGALDRVLKGAPNLLRRTIAFRAEVERHQFWTNQTLADDIIACVEEMGFVLLGDSFTSDAFAQSDVLFLNKDWLRLIVREDEES